MALMPVCSGSCTGWRCMTQGACSSRARRPSVSISPRPSIGLPSGSTTRPRKPSPTGTERISPVRWTGWPSSMPRTSPRTTTPISRDVEVQREAEGAVLELEQLVGHGRGQTLDARDAVTGLGDRADLLARRPPARTTGRSARARPGSPPAGSSAPPSRFPALFVASVRRRAVWSAVRAVAAWCVRRSAGEPAAGLRPGGARRVPSMTSSPTRDPDAAEDVGVDVDVEVHLAAVDAGAGPRRAGRCCSSVERRPPR